MTRVRGPLWSPVLPQGWTARVSGAAPRDRFASQRHRRVEAAGPEGAA